MRKLIGIWVEETDTLYDFDINFAAACENNELGLKGEYRTDGVCELIHPETAEVLAVYKDDFYAGRAALTVNSFGEGKVYYMAFKNNDDLLTDFYDRLTDKIKPLKAIDADLPEGVTAQLRTDGERDFVFLLNFAAEEKVVNLGGKSYKDVLTGESVRNEIKLQKYGFKILERR